MKIIITFIILLITIITLVIYNFRNQFGKAPFGERLVKIKKSPNYIKDEFENRPVVNLKFSFKTYLTMFWDSIKGNKNSRPTKRLPSNQPVFDKNSGAFLTWFGHSTFLYEIDNKKILFDPMLGTHASPIPYLISRYPYDLPSSAKDLPHLDAVIISHDHYDHLDYETIQILKDKVDKFIMPLGVGSHLEYWGINKDRIIELDWWDSIELDEILIVSTPSQHFSGRGISDRKKTLWSAWIIKNKTANVFFGGDSGYFPGFKEIGKKYGPFDLTLLDSGQYDKRWEIVHMFPEQSVIAHKDLNGKVFMPIHWSAFTLAFHDWTEPIEKALVASLKEKLDLISPKIGERFNVITDRPRELWWRNLN